MPTDLLAACQAGDHGHVNHLLETGHFTPRALNMALRATINPGYVRCMHLLIRAGALVDVPGPDGSTALHDACSSDQTVCAQLLIDADADVNIVDRDGLTALHLACLSGHSACVLLLIDAGTEITKPTDVQDEGTATDAFLTCDEDGPAHGAQLLINARADVNLAAMAQNNMATATHLACLRGELRSSSTVLTAI